MDAISKNAEYAGVLLVPIYALLVARYIFGKAGILHD